MAKVLTIGANGIVESSISTGGLTNFTESKATYLSKEYAKLTPSSSSTDVSLVFQPKGTGYFSLQEPDGTAAGGNNRGNNAVDLQMSRPDATQVASGSYSFAQGANNTASGSYSFAQGANNTASGSYSFAQGANNTASGYSSIAQGANNTASEYSSIAQGRNNTASGNYSFAQGYYCTASGTGSSAQGMVNTASGYSSFAQGNYCVASGDNSFAQGAYASSYLQGGYAHSNGRFSTTGDAQKLQLIARGVSSSTSSFDLKLDGSSANLTLPNFSTWFFVLHLSAMKTNSSALNAYSTLRLGMIARRDSAGSTVLSTYGALTPDLNVGTFPSPTIALSADTTNGALKITITPTDATSTRWVAVLDICQVGNGSSF